MALKQSEKILIGAALVAGGLAIFLGLGRPQFDAYTANNTQLNTLIDELKNLQLEKDSLTGQIAILEKNTDIPLDINVKTYTDDNREVVIKQMLNQVVELATGVGNQFISLSPTEVDPLISAPAKASTTKAAPSPQAQEENPEAQTSEEPKAQTSEGEPAAATPPMLTTFGYQLAIRGTYQTIQNFLKQMTLEREIMEITTINVVNESKANSSAGSADAVSDPGAPIKLTVTIRLAMQQVSPDS
jgi:hypothetical protein